MFRRSAAVLAALLLSVPASAQTPESLPAAPPDLSLRLPAGRAARFELRVLVGRSRRTGFGESLNNVDWRQDVEVTAEAPPTGVTSRLAFAFGRGRLAMLHPILGFAEFDSASPPAPADLNPILLLAAGYYAGYTGRTLRMDLDRTGRIVDVDGEEAIQEGFAQLASLGEPFARFKPQFEINGKLFFSAKHIRRFLQPLVPQTPEAPVGIGVEWRARNDAYLPTGSNDAREWPWLVALESADRETARLRFSGERIQRSPYVFGDKDAARRAPDPSAKGQTVKLTASGEGVIDLADGLWRTAKLELLHEDDKPAPTPDPGPSKDDQLATDRITYEIRRVDVFEPPPAPKEAPDSASRPASREAGG
ncbi:MAG TPA: hypothetical protein VEI02_12605 [Planctomycetota bacterium]|nr:hypothetical protein [Planctomycetota bacterium]